LTDSLAVLIPSDSVLNDILTLSWRRAHLFISF
jgi:hypothetical protein